MPVNTVIYTYIDWIADGSNQKQRDIGSISMHSQWLYVIPALMFIIVNPNTNPTQQEDTFPARLLSAFSHSRWRGAVDRCAANTRAPSETCFVTRLGVPRFTRRAWKCCAVRLANMSLIKAAWALQFHSQNGQGMHWYNHSTMMTIRMICCGCCHFDIMKYDIWYIIDISDYHHQKDQNPSIFIILSVTWCQNPKLFHT